MDAPPFGEQGDRRERVRARSVRCETPPRREDAPRRGRQHHRLDTFQSQTKLYSVSQCASFHVPLP
jgi:hypothetical protein